MLDSIIDVSQILIADIVLSGDNALIIGMAAAAVPEASRKKVIFIGDGNSDLQGARQADFVFAVKGSHLNSYFQNSFSTFTELKEKITEII